VRLNYLLKRIGVFLITLFIALSAIFFLPRISGQNPIREKLLEEATRGGYLQSAMEEMVKIYEAKFGMDKPLMVQYLNYMRDIFRFDFGYSIYTYPKKAGELILETLPWTLVLGGMATLMGFVLGTMLGALIAWQKSPGWLQYLFMPLLTLSAVPYYLLGLILLLVFAFHWKLFPLFGAYSVATFPNWGSITYLLDVAHHAVLPALSVVLTNAGFWALGMRGMMVTMQGEDYMLLSEAKGLKSGRIFAKYAIRNALLPQTTALALSLGTIASNLVLVEVVFSYPGVGGLLVQSIIHSDFYVLNAVVFVIIFGIAFGTLVLDLVYPLLDPRITYERA
jgi:peptide/nickel transport system permease protein